MDRMEGWAIDADLAIRPLQDLGWRVEPIPWRKKSIDWNTFDAVYICVPWDYPDDPEYFLEVLESIDRSSAVLANDIRIVRWNLRKTYLRDLEAGGAPIVPSLWRDAFNPQELDEFFGLLDVDRIIIKPVVSTNASNTFLLDRASASNSNDDLARTFVQREFVVQPFIENIQSEGEYSLFYFNNLFSHAICKVPKQDDFRVQEEHGGQVTTIEPEPALLAAGDKALSIVDPMPVYARADFVRDENGQFVVMELELIEPSMYLRMKEGSAELFAAAFDSYAEANTPSVLKIASRR